MVQIHLKEILKERGKTAKWLANELQVTEVAISNIVRGKNYPTYDLLERMAQVLNVKLSTLLGEEPLKVVDESCGFASYIRYKGIHYTADSLGEFWHQVDELRAIAGK
jgi:transcriptional regulator with XRE-family HTH domain